MPVKNPNNLELVTASIRERFSELKIIVTGSSEIGKRAAEMVAKKYGRITPPHPPPTKFLPLRKAKPPIL